MTGKSGPDIQINDPKAIARLKAEFSNYHRHGDMFTHDDNLQVVLPDLDTPVKSTGWNNGDSTGADHVVVDGANGTITIGDKGGGRYQMYSNFSFSSSKANIEAHGHFFLGGVQLDKFSFKRSISTANDLGNASIPPFTKVLAPGDVLDFRFETDTNTVTLDIEHGGWGILWVAGE